MALCLQLFIYGILNLTNKYCQYNTLNVQKIHSFEELEV